MTTFYSFKKYENYWEIFNYLKLYFNDTHIMPTFSPGYFDGVGIIFVFKILKNPIHKYNVNFGYDFFL